MKFNNFIPKKNTSLLLWLNYIKNSSKNKINLTLSRIKKVAQYLDLLKTKSFVFTVTGTNGKGTTCYLIEKILIAAGYKVGLYSSPHLRRYTERIKINGYELPPHYHTQSFNVIESNKKKIFLTYFEYSTLSALMIFKQANIDIMILEVGLGGRYDATNIIDPDISIIVNVDIDHTYYLGLDKESIGNEKSGIFRKNKPAILGKNMPQSVLLNAKKINSIILQKNKDWFIIKNSKTWNFKNNDIELKNIPYIKYYSSNAYIAVAALKYSNLLIKEKVFFSVLSNIQNLPGRFHIFKNKKKPIVILDVAHNPQAAKKLAKKINKYFSNFTIHAVVGMCKDKDIFNTLNHFRDIVDYWYCSKLNSSRSASVEEIIQYIPRDKNPKKFNNIFSAYFDALNNSINNKDIILVFGSFYAVSAVLNILEYRKKHFCNL